VTLRPALLLTVAVAVGCSPPPPPTPAPEPAPSTLANSDLCYLVQAAAAKTPSLEVDRAPDVVKYEPRPLQPPRGGYPRNVIRRDGTTKVKVSVVVDTTGKPDMSTFTVVETTHQWLSDNLKTTIPKWTFTPAYKNGCRVAGLWVFTATPGKRPTPATPARRPAASTRARPPAKPLT
jgi:hypothetical protein